MIPKKAEPFMKKNKDDFYTFALIPHSPEQKTFVLKVPRRVAKAAVFSAVSAFVVLLSVFVYSSHMARKVVSYEDIKSKLLVQDRQMKKFEDQARLLSEELDTLNEREDQIRKMLGLKSNVGNMRLSPDSGKKDDPDIKNKLDRINTNIKDKKDSLGRLLAFAKEFRKRFSSMPSIRPIYGRVISSFGYRIFPWRGFHTGIDITADYGSPIRASAGGVVEFTGWETGYGKTVIIDHGFGYKTLYGHASGFAVSPGNRVKKGQVIAYVGATGYATGPHLHYEVIRDGEKVNPSGYLDLNLAGSFDKRRL